MRLMMILSAALVAMLGATGRPNAQGVDLELYVGPPAAYYYGPAPYAVYDAYEPGAYSYYAPGISVYRRRNGDPSPNDTGAFFRRLDRDGRGGNGGN